MSWLPQVKQKYYEKDAFRIEAVLTDALQKGYLDENDVYEVLDFLPKIFDQRIKVDNSTLKESKKSQFNSNNYQSSSSDGSKNAEFPDRGKGLGNGRENEREAK